jgi:NAD(P)H-hydrate epimerase
MNDFTSEHPVYSVATMRDAETRATSEYGIPLAQLMDTAGRGLADTALDMLASRDSLVWVCCGAGNNGGDGFVCAKALRECGVPVEVFAIGFDSLGVGTLARDAADELLASDGTITPIVDSASSIDTISQAARAGVSYPAAEVSRLPIAYAASKTSGARLSYATLDSLADAPTRPALVVDCLLGTGLSRPVDGVYARVIADINALSVAVLACDVPSGIDADNGQVMGTAVRATRTIMMGLAKPACRLEPGCVYFGDAVVADIGLPDRLVASLDPLSGPASAISCPK